MRALLPILLLASLASAGQPFFTGSPADPSAEVIDQVTIFMNILLPMMLAFVALGVVVYVAGQMLGAETRARATVWAHGIFAAVGITALIIVVLNFILPGFFSGQIGDVGILEKLVQLRGLAATFLIGLTVVLIMLAAVVYAAGMVAGAESRARATAWASAMVGGAVFTAVIYVVLGQIIPGLESIFVGTTVNIYAIAITNLVFFVAFFILITYLISKVFKIPEWEAYLNIEFSNLMGSFLLVLFVAGMFAAGIALAMVYTGGEHANPPRAAIAYMQDPVIDSTLQATVDVYKIQACTSMLSTLSRRIGDFVLTQTFKLFPGLDTFVSITNVLSFALLVIYSGAKAQVGLMYLFEALVFPFILPAGLVLRFFPPTRDAGAFLISLAFGFYVVFPMTYLLNGHIFTELGGKPYNQDRPTLLINTMCGPLKYGAAGLMFNPAVNPIFSLIPGGQTVGTALSVIISEGLLNMFSMSEFIPIMKRIGDLSLLAMFMPALSLTITIAFINSMTKFIVSKV